MFSKAAETKKFYSCEPRTSASSNKKLLGNATIAVLFHKHHSIKENDNTPTLAETNVPSEYSYELSNKQTKRVKKYILLTSAIAGVVVFIGIGAMFSFYKNHYALNTFIAGINVSNKTESQARVLLMSKTASFTTSIEVKEKTIKPSLTEIGLDYDIEKTLRDVASKKLSWAAKLQFWRKSDTDIVVTYDEKKSIAYFDSVVNLATEPAVDAKLIIENGEGRILPEKKGITLGIGNGPAKVYDAAKKLEPILLKAESFSTEPMFTTSVLAPYRDKLTSMINTTIGIAIDAKTSTITPDDIANWVVLTPNASDKTLDIAIDDGQISAYVDSLAQPYVRPPKAQIVTKDQVTGQEKIIAQGRSGTDVVGKTDVVKQIKRSVETSTPSTLKLSINYADYKTVTSAEYDKWLEVDVTNKRMYAYEKGTLVKTVLITAGAPATPTVLGQYAVYAKYDKQDMRGLNADGTKYYQPNVQWVSYFYQDYAVHGNYWRPTSYFGNVNSSHGCVGIVNTDAKFVYDWAPIGTPVITHE